VPTELDVDVEASTILLETPSTTTVPPTPAATASVSGLLPVDAGATPVLIAVLPTPAVVRGTVSPWEAPVIAAPMTVV